MVSQTFNTLKFKRTYVGGSKQSELEAFKSVQGINEDNSDWLKYRIIFMAYSYDLLIVLMSWRYVLNIISYGLLIIGILITLINSNISIVIIILGLITRLFYIKIKAKELDHLFIHNFVLNMVSNKIRALTGLIITNN